MATKVQCPAPGECGFEGKPQSVHAHITSSNEHKGESGVSWEREIANELPNGEQAPWERSGTEAVEEQRETGEEVTEEVLDRQGEQVIEEDVESDEDPSVTEETDGEDPEEPAPGEIEEEGGVPSIPLPMDKTTLVLIVGLVVVLGLLYRQGYFSSDEPVQEESVDEETEPVGDAGLIGA